jgi:hypothetical protein
MLVVGLSLIGLFFLFPSKSVERRVRSAPPEQLPVPRTLIMAYSLTQTIGGQSVTNLYTATPNGRERTLIGPPNAYEPAWSPDGLKLLFTTSITAAVPSEINVMNADGTNVINLTNTPGIAERNPSWSVTGKIAYERDGQIWTMNSDGSNQVLFPIPQPTPSGPAWSPDGTKLAFSSDRDIWIINADGTHLRRLTVNSEPDIDPAWSPDGLKIAYGRVFFMSQAPGLRVINVDGTNDMRLFAQDEFNGPSWSSDYAKIAVLRRTSIRDEVYVINSDNTGPAEQAIDITGSRLNGVAWRPFRPVSRTHFDFDGDTRDDFAVYRAGATPTAQSYWHILRSATNTYQGVQFGAGEDKLVPADYDGDGKNDIAVWRPSTGTWYTSLDPASNYGAVQWGIDGDIPLPGDFDGDGSADLAVFRPSDGVWYILYSSDHSFVGQQFGASTDKPLLMDYDGDGKTDLAFVRTIGTDYFWCILRSSNNTTNVPRFGVMGDKIVPADYNGDGKSDLAVYSPSTSSWSVLLSTGTLVQQWGMSGDVPIPGNFDSDGKADFAVFRPGTATWSVRRSVFEGGTITQQWGLSTDFPVPAAYIP